MVADRENKVLYIMPDTSLVSFLVTTLSIEKNSAELRAARNQYIS